MIIGIAGTAIGCVCVFYVRHFDVAVPALF